MRTIDTQTTQITQDQIKASIVDGILDGNLITSFFISKGKPWVGEKYKQPLKYQKSTALKDSGDEIPWCSCFCNFVMKKAGYGGTHSAVARSWLNYGTELTQPRFGCITVLKRGNQPWTGHVGFYVGETLPGTIRLLSGNVDSKVCIENFQKSDIIGLRWPNKTVKIGG